MVGTATKLGDHIPLTTDRDLVLQVCGTNRAGQIVRLKSHKCSIGSGEHCTLRVRSHSVKPLHCVIFRGQADTFVRSWAHDTRLNGQSFSDARLSPGDRIGIGSIEFAVLDPTDNQIDHVQASESLETTPPAKPESVDGTGNAGQDDVERLTTRLALANRQGRSRLRRLIKQLRLARTDPLAPAQESTAASACNDTAHQADEMEEQRRQWEIVRTEAEEQLGARAKDLDEQVLQLESLEAALHRQRTEWEASLAEAEEQLVVRAAGVDKREAELDSRLAELHNASVAADVMSSDLGSSDTISMEDLLLANEQTEAAFIEALAADEQPSDHAATNRPEASKPELQSPIDVPADDESVDTYMARLLGRVRGQDAAPKV